MSSAASPPAMLSLTSSWSARSEERRILSSLLSPHRFVHPLVLVSGPKATGKSTIVLDALTSSRAHFAYVDCAASGVVGDKMLLKRITAQVTDSRAGPRLFRQLCCAPSSDDDQSLSASSERLNAQDHSDSRGRKKRRTEDDVVGGGIPLHPDAIVDDITLRAGADAAIAPSASAASAAAAVAPASSSAAAAAVAASSSSVAAPAISADASVNDPAALAAAQLAAASSTRSQLAELVRCVSGLRHAHTLRHGIDAVEGGSAPPPPTLYLVLHNPDRLVDTHPNLLPALVALHDQTMYPVVLVLIARSMPSRSPELGAFGLSRAVQGDMLVLPFRPYSAEESASIVAERLWRSNRFIEQAFRSGAPAGAHESPAWQSSAYACWRGFVEGCLQIFHHLSNDLLECEHTVRALLPSYLTALRARMDERARRTAASTQTTRMDSVERERINAGILLTLEGEMKRRMESVWRHEEMPGVRSRKRARDEAAATATGDASAATAATAAAVTPISSPARASSSASGNAVRNSMSLVASASSASDLPLSRLSKFLLLASFLASYNPPSSDTALFTHGVRKRSNRRGKSAAIERRRTAFDSASAAAERQVSQLSLGPNAAPLERVLAIALALLDDDERPSLAVAYQQLKSLLAVHLLEQVATGGAAALRRGADLLSGVKIRCLVSKEDMERICDSIEPPKSVAGAMGQGARMGERITLSAYLYDGKKK